ncbi:hypothetical protein J2X12_004132 [Pseudarthrobacter oxydans]|uniref:Uncharacterized protein n=1 Tax=Pseudarthrobacter oxydans TaxID=1671 RepID=A0AAW8NER8_PSEOX|nr:hypothetical protein [Pseudarthrobacter oxydans]MDR6794720.1 hypothetical protein [Pseudarthrobacter oxydans]MDR7166078.1 hypothetical protein [Pseudarthrobacter oxydans]
MSEVESLSQSKTGLRHLQLITKLVDSEHLDRDRQVGTSALYEDAKAHGLPRESVTGDLEALQERGWLWFEKMNAGILTVVLNQAGVDVAEEFKEMRSNRKRRNQEARKGVLLWLEEEYHAGRTSPNIVEFTSSKYGNFWGDPYVETEVDAATRWCRDEGYLEGTAAFGGPVVRPTITNKGLAYIEGTDSTSLQNSRGGDVYNINAHGPFAWAQNSPYASVNISMSQEHVKQVHDMLDSYREIIGAAGVSAEVVAETEIIAAEIEDEITSAAPEGGKVKALGEKLGELAATGTVTAIVNALNAVIQQGIAGL